MNEKIEMKSDNPEPSEDGRRANPSYYLDRMSLTILMLMKLAEGLTKLCIAVLCAFMLNSFVSAVNTILKDGSVSGKAMIAQILKTIRVPAENIRQVVAAVPSNIAISPKLPLYVFAIFLPFVMISVLEAIALIRLRLGKGGTRTIGILQWIYCVLDTVMLLAFTLLAVVLSLLSLIRLGGTLGIMFAAVFFSLAVFFIPVKLPAVLYHRNIAGIMKDIRYEMGTGMQAVRRWINFKKFLGFLMALEVAGTVISLMAYWRPTQKEPAMAMLVMIIALPALKLLKYICVMFFYQNFMQTGSAVESKGSASHKPQIILVTLVTVAFVFASALICAQSVAVSRAVIERAETFFNNAEQTVDQISSQADQQINAVQQAIESKTGTEGTTENPQQETTENPQQETTDNPQQDMQEETTGTRAAPEAGTKEETE